MDPALLVSLQGTIMDRNAEVLSTSNCHSLRELAPLNAARLLMGSVSVFLIAPRWYLPLSFDFPPVVKRMLSLENKWDKVTRTLSLKPLQ
jgi:hypothetical protein